MEGLDHLDGHICTLWSKTGQLWEHLHRHTRCLLDHHCWCKWKISQLLSKDAHVCSSENYFVSWNLLRFKLIRSRHLQRQLFFEHSKIIFCCWILPGLNLKEEQVHVTDLQCPCPAWFLPYLKIDLRCPCHWAYTRRVTILQCTGCRLRSVLPIPMPFTSCRWEMQQIHAIDQDWGPLLDNQPPLVSAECLPIGRKW